MSERPAAGLPEGMVRQTRTMLALQDEMNARVDVDWLNRDRAWYRAIWIECAELMDHYGGWKWWKASTRDVEQVMLEIVDIWHFGLSIRITPTRDHDAAARRIVQEWLHPVASVGFLQDVERLAAHALQTRDLEVSLVPTLLADIGRDFDALFRAYVGKNVLNVFRQDHGYREGSYRKLWAGREDNIHLVEIQSTLDSAAPDYRQALYSALAARYAA
jgi:hypothetical protein